MDVGNRAPTAVGTVVALTFTFGDSVGTRDVASNFNDPENEPLIFTASTSVSAIATARVSGSVITVTPVGVGSATITVTAHDPDGLSVTQTIAVTVNPLVPITPFPLPVQPIGTVAALTFTLGDSAGTRDVASNFNAPDNDSLIFTASTSDSTVATASVSGSVVTVTPVGGGSATITVTAQDPDGLSATQTIAVTVIANQAPVSVGKVAAVTFTLGDSAYIRDIALYFNDPDNDPLTYTASTSTSRVATASISGSVVTVTPVAVGSATITVTAQDLGGLSTTQTIAVTVFANQAPVSLGKVAALTFTLGDPAETRDVVSNFNDPDNAPLTFTTSTSASAVATALVSGSVVTVTPVGAGSATITVTAQDPGGLSATQAIAVTVIANQALVSVGTVAALTFTLGDSAGTRDVVSNFNDPDDAPLTFTASTSDSAIATVLVSGSVVTVTPVGVGSATITVTAQAPGGLSATQTIAVTVNAVNQAPVSLGTVAAVTFTVGDSVATRDVASNFSDPDNDPLTYTASTSASGVATASVSGSVVTVTPVAVGSATITVTAEDLGGLSATQTIAVMVSPVIVYPSSVLAEISDFDGDPGDRFTILATVNYLGTGIIAPTTVKYYLSSNSTIESSDTEVGDPYDISSSSISGSKNEPVSDRVNAPNSPGTYYYGVCVETATTTPVCSNGVEVVVYVVEPDSVSAEIVSFNGEAGDRFSLRATVHYTGTGTTAETTVKYYLSSDSTITSSDTEVGTDSVSSRSAPTDEIESIGLDAPSSPGTYYYGACVETATTTPICSNGVEVVVEEFVIDPESISASVSGFDLGDPGDRFTLSVTVRYSGSGTTAPTTVKYYRSSDSSITSSDIEVGDQDDISSSSISSSRNESVSDRINAPNSPGTYYYGACAETDTKTICSSEVEVVVEEPVIDISSISVSVSGFDGDPGDRFKLSASIRYSGSGTTALTAVGYYRSTNLSTNGILLGNDSIFPRSAPTTEKVSINTDAPSTPGTYYYRSCAVTATTTICSSGVAVTVSPPPPPDYTITSYRISDRCLALHGDYFILYTTVSNIGDGAGLSTRLVYYRSIDERISSNDIQIGSSSPFSIQANTERGEEEERFNSVAATLGSYGTHYIYACVGHPTGETSVNNNCSRAEDVIVTSSSAADGVSHTTAGCY